MHPTEYDKRLAAIVHPAPGRYSKPSVRRAVRDHSQALHDLLALVTPSCPESGELARLGLKVTSSFLVLCGVLGEELPEPGGQ